MEEVIRNRDSYNPNDIRVNAPDFEEPTQNEVYRYENLEMKKDLPVEKPTSETVKTYNKNYRLKKPFIFEDERITEVYLDLDNLTGKDILDASKSVDSFVQETDKRYLSNVAAKAMKRPKEIMYYMSAKDVTAICYLVSDFLID